MKRAQPDFNAARPTLSLATVQRAINWCSEDTVDMMEVSFLYLPLHFTRIMLTIARSLTSLT